MARQRWNAVGRRHAISRSIKLTPATAWAEFTRLLTRGTDHGFHAGSSRTIIVSCIGILPSESSAVLADRPRLGAEWLVFG